MAVLLRMLRGLGYDANCGTLILGYLIGYLATAIPIPAGIGVLEGWPGGHVGALRRSAGPDRRRRAHLPRNRVLDPLARWPGRLHRPAFAFPYTQRETAMHPTHDLSSFAHAAHTVKTALLAIVLRHYGLELRRAPATIAPDRREARPKASAPTSAHPIRKRCTAERPNAEPIRRIAIAAGQTSPGARRRPA